MSNTHLSKSNTASSNINNNSSHNASASALSLTNSETPKAHNSAIHTTNNNIYKHIDANTVAAFICFEYSESLARCIEDYERYATFPMSMFYPEHLKFRGMKIKVSVL